MPNREVLDLKLHRGQATVFHDTRRFKVVVAGRRWGKTRLSRAKIVRACRMPRRRIWYVAPTYGMARSILWDELKLEIPRRWVYKINETRMTITLVNGTVIELKGADKPDTLRGVGLHYAILDEAQDMDEDVWFKVLRPTLLQTKGDALIIGTPKSFNWFYDLYVLGQRGDFIRDSRGRQRRNPWKSWQFSTSMSPFVSREELEAAKHDMDEKTYRQEFEASFETMSGRVYHTFDRTVHVGDYAFDPRLPIWIGQDFNIDPMSSVIMQPQPDGEVRIVDELVLFGSNTQEVADELSRRYFKHFKQIELFPDPAGANRSTKGRGESDVEILREAGFEKIIYRKKHPRVADRINGVNRMFKSADGQIKMRVDRNCKNTIIALEQTIYKPGTREVDKRPGVEHPADAIGYCIDIKFPLRKFSIIGASI